jgi:hypothetical protein
LPLFAQVPRREILGRSLGKLRNIAHSKDALGCIEVIILVAKRATERATDEVAP